MAAVAEIATGVALILFPLLVGGLLLGAEPTGLAIPIARVTGIALLAFGHRLLARSRRCSAC